MLWIGDGGVHTPLPHSVEEEVEAQRDEDACPECAASRSPSWVQTQTGWPRWLLATTPHPRLISQESLESLFPVCFVTQPVDMSSSAWYLRAQQCGLSVSVLPAWCPTNGRLSFPTCAIPMPFPLPGRLPLENEDFGAWLCHQGCVWHYASHSCWLSQGFPAQSGEIMSPRPLVLWDVSGALCVLREECHLFLLSVKTSVFSLKPPPSGSLLPAFSSFTRGGSWLLMAHCVFLMAPLPSSMLYHSS